MNPPKAVTQGVERVVSLDLFRGIAIAGMIVVDNPGNWSQVYPPLAHSEWHGWTLADLVFPFFLFIVGIAVTFSLQGRSAEPKVLLRIFRRAAVLFTLGFFLNAFPYLSDLATLRVLGVLQRIALCYLASAFVFLGTGTRGRVITVTILLTVHVTLMRLVPVPGYGAGVLEKEGNLSAYVDNLLLHGHLYYATWDPEGLLSTIPAIATTLLGVLSGQWLKAKQDAAKKTLGLLGVGVAAAFVGERMDVWFPINKSLWSCSYVVLSGGLALILLGTCYWLVDVRGHRRLATPLVAFGANSLTVYVLSTVVARLLELFTVGGSAATAVTLRKWLCVHFFRWAPPAEASLLYALTYLLLWLPLMAALYRRRIFIRL